MILAYVNIDLQQIPEWDLTINKYENIQELYLDIDVSSSLTVLSNYTQRVLGKFSLKTSSSYTYKREKERDIEWERKDKLKLVMYVDTRMI